MSKIFFLCLFIMALSLAAFCEDDINNLNSAVLNGDIKSVTKLIKAGVDVNLFTDSGDLPLISSVISSQKNSLEISKLLISAGADVNKQDKSLNSPIAEASRISPDITELLISKGANVNIKDMFDNTPLHRAVIANAAAVIKLLLDAGADISVQNYQGITPLIQMMGTDNPDILKLFIDKGINLNAPTGKEGLLPIEYAMRMESKKILEPMLNAIDINILNAKGSNILETAIIMDNKLTIEYILSHGFDINAPINKHGDRAIHVACQLYKPELLKQLISRGADVNIRNTDGNTPLCDAVFYSDLVEILLFSNANVNIRNNFLTGPLALAVISGREKTVGLLVSKGASLDAIDINAKSIMDIAEEKNDSAIINILKNSSANNTDNELFTAVKSDDITKVNSIADLEKIINLPDNEGNTPVFYVKSKEMLNLLISKGADIKLINYSGRNPLQLACLIGNNPVIDTLIAGGVDINSKDYASLTALHLSVGRPEIVKELILKGADVNAADILGDTPLILAAKNNIGSVMEALINAGADVNAKNKSGKSALYFAVAAQNLSGCDYLLKSKADVNVLDDMGNTPLFAAVSNSNIDIVNLLLSAGADANHINSLNQNPLICASEANKSLDILRLIIDKTGNVNLKDNQGYNALFYAISNASLEYVKLLSASGVRAEEVGNSNLLHELLIQPNADSHKDIFDVLISMGVDINKKGDLGTPLFLSVSQGAYEVTKSLISAGADVKSDSLALAAALRGSNAQIAVLLLESGADINQRLYSDVTPLMLAVKYSNVSVVESLLARGVDVNARSSSNFTAIHLVPYNKEANKLAELLISKGAAMNTLAEDNISPFYNALIMNKPDLVQTFIKAGADQTIVNSTALQLSDSFGYDGVSAVLSGKAIPDTYKKELSDNIIIKLEIHNVSNIYNAARVMSRIDAVILNSISSWKYEGDILSVNVVTSYGLGRVYTKINSLEERNLFRLSVISRLKDSLIIDCISM